MMMPPWLQFLMYLTMAMTAAALVGTARQFLLEARAERNLARLMAARDEFQPVLRWLWLRAQQNGALTFSEHEAIDLRELVRQAAACLTPSEERQIVRGLYNPSVSGREGYLRYVLSTSIRTLQHQR